MSEYVKPALRAILCHDPRFSDAARLSATSEAGPSFDTPEVESGTPRARLEAYTGADDSGLSEVWVQASKAGTALPGGGAAQVLWSPGDPAINTQRGWLPPQVATGFEWVGFETGSIFYYWPNAIELADKSLLTAYVRVATTTEIRCTRTPPEGVAGSEATITDDISWSAGVTETGPALVQLPDGRVLCFYITLNNGLSMMNMAYSTDDGVTWELGVSEASGISQQGNVFGLKVAYHGGYLTALIWSGVGCSHYVSDTMGASWQHIEDLTAYGANLVAVPGGGCGLVYCDDTGTKDLKWCSKSGAFSGFAVDNALSLAGSTAQNYGVDVTGGVGFIASTICQDGSICVAFRRHGAATGSRIGIVRFNPSIATGAQPYSEQALWEYSPLGSLRYYDADPLQWGDENEAMTRLSLCPFQGSLILLSNFTGAASVKTKSIGRVTLGGWSSITFQPCTFGSYNNATPYGIAYLPFVHPGDVAGWTRTGAGASTLTSGGLEQSFAGATTDYYSVTGGSTGLPMLAWVTHNQVTGGSLTAADSFVRCRWANGTTDHNVVLRFSSTGARLTDANNTGATLGSDVSGLTANTAYDWLFYLNGSTVYVWYKLTTSQVWIQQWALTPTASGSPAASHLFSWGTNSTNASTARWRFVGVSHYDNPPDGIRASVLWSLRGRPLGISPVYVANSLSIRAARAAVMRGDTWSVPLRYRYGADAIDPMVSPSPARPWRSTTTGQQIISWDLGDDTFLGPAIGMHIARPLGRTWVLEGSQDNSTWTTLISIDAATGLSGLTCQRVGDILMQNGGAVGTDYIAGDELRGGWAIIESGGTTYVREILSNEEGVWMASAKALRIRIDGASTAPSSGTLSVIRPMVTGINWDVPDHYRYWRVKVSALSQDSGSPGYLEAGAIVIGPALPFGIDYSWGRVTPTQVQQEITTLVDGTRSVRVLSVPRRSVEFQWTDPIPTHHVYKNFTTNGPPAYIAGEAGGTALATRHSPELLAGIVRRQQGAFVPVVYLPTLAWSGSGTTETRYQGQIYGRIITDTFSQVATSGKALATEVTTLGTCRIEEEI